MKTQLNRILEHHKATLECAKCLKSEWDSEKEDYIDTATFLHRGFSEYDLDVFLSNSGNTDADFIFWLSDDAWITQEWDEQNGDTYLLYHKRPQIDF